MVFWTEGSIRKVAGDVISGPEGATNVRKHVEDLLRAEGISEVGIELRKAAEKLAENAKANLHRKLNSIYAAQCERLEQKLMEFMVELDRRAPDQERRLDALTKRLAGVEASCKGWLEEPRQQLESLVKERQKLFSDELGKISKNSANRLKAAHEKAEQNFANLIEDRLHDLVIEAVREHVRSVPFEKDKLSNRQIAVAKGISLREVKRQRNRGLL